MAIYLFLINGVLWAWQQSDYAHLHKDISIFTQVTACTDGRTDRLPVFILIIYIYITLYLTRLVLGDTNNRQVNKTIILCSNKLREYKKIIYHYQNSLQFWPAQLSQYKFTSILSTDALLSTIFRYLQRVEDISITVLPPHKKQHPCLVTFSYTTLKLQYANSRE